MAPSDHLTRFPTPLTLFGKAHALSEEATDAQRDIDLYNQAYLFCSIAGRPW